MLTFAPEERPNSAEVLLHAEFLDRVHRRESARGIHHHEIVVDTVNRVVVVLAALAVDGDELRTREGAFALTPPWSLVPGISMISRV